MPDAAELIRDATAKFASLGLDHPRLDAEVLLRHALGIDRTRLFIRLREPVEPGEIAVFRALVDRRSTGEPIAYITGERGFMGLTFVVGPGVLVPRPETELMVEWATNWLASRPPGIAIDVGTGSGAIILSLAHALLTRRGDRLIGSDLSLVALDYAVRNRALIGLDKRVELIRGDLLSWLGTPVDLVMANLPYLTPEQVAESPGIQWEPPTALISGLDGLESTVRLAGELPHVLAPRGAAIFELDPAQAQHVADVLVSIVPGSRVTTMQDLAGLDRFVLVEKA